MRKLGLIGGMSWISTEIYYRDLNKGFRRERGGMASAPLVLESLNFAEMGRAEDGAGWEKATRLLADSAKRLEDMGAGAILICANSMHKVHEQVSEAVDVPLLHIADAVGEAMSTEGVKTAALVGTRNVMAEPWYRQRLVKHGISLLPPEMDRVDMIDRIIYEELMQGEFKRQSERDMKTILTNLAKAGAEAAVLGCTELSLVVDTRANVLPIFDSTECHVRAGLNWLLEEETEKS